MKFGRWYKWPWWNGGLMEYSEANLRDCTVREVAPLLDIYSDWYQRKGLVIPPDIANDPTEWTIRLQKMQRAFNLAHDELNGEGDLWEAKNKWKKYGEEDVEEIKQLEKEIREGFMLFGQYLYDLRDNMYPNENGAPEH